MAVTALVNDVHEWERRLQAETPELRLISERHLNRVLAAMIAAGVRVPMNAALPVWMDQADGLRFGVPSSSLEGSGPRILLLTPPADRLLYDEDDATLTAAYTRLIDRAKFAEMFNDGATWADAELTRRFESLPASIRREVRYVLNAEHILPPDPTEAEVCRAFLAIYLELRTNRPDVVSDYFPLLAATSPDLDPLLYGLPLFPPKVESAPEEYRVAPHPSPADPSAILSQTRNVVRTAITYYRRPEDRATAVALVREGLGQLLGDVLQWQPDRTEKWKDVLAALLPHTLGGRWTAATKALYELQSLALDRRDNLSAVAPFEWLRSRGQRPLRQPLDKARDAILLRRLAKAHNQIDAIPLPKPVKESFEKLLEHERHAAEGQMRESLTPIIRSGLSRAGLEPANRVEAVARDKLVAELVDTVCTRGFFRLSDLRDALARNDLKLTDLASTREWLTGDALLRADKFLGDELYGIYQRGESYLRAIQRLSAAAFGTPTGRAVTLFVLLPLLGAFLTLEFVQHVLHAVLKVVELVRPSAHPHEHHHGPHLVTWWSMPLVGGLYLLLLNSAAFRQHCLLALSRVGTVLSTALVSVPQAVWRSRGVQAFIRSPVTVFLWQNVALPFAVAVGGFAVAILYNLSPHDAVYVGTAAFLVSLLVLRSPAGQILYDQVSEGVLDMGRYVWASLIPGAISWIVWAFREVAAAVEQVLYTVDEWLRFREGQSNESLLFKTVVAILWFPVAYVVRFVFYLLVEPQVNPVKHFPVVTVSHKVIWPMVPQIAAMTGLSDWTVAMMVNGVPGIFGFIAWELKENWRLYASNRSDRLRPDAIGHHGETVRGLLRPGFHSGTIPKIYRRSRMLQEFPAAPIAKLTRTHHELDHTAESVQRFVERELLPLLDEPGVSVERVSLGCQRVEVTVKNASNTAPLALSWELMGNEIVADVARRGWLASAEESKVKRILTAVAGLNAKAAVTTPEPPAWDEWVKRWD